MDHERPTSERDVPIGDPPPANSGAAAADPSSIGAPAAKPVNPQSSKFARWIATARAARRKFFDEQLFADPAWDMLLELYALRGEGCRISVSKLSVAAGVPCTTALRWIQKLESEGLVVRCDDPLDGRRVWVELSDHGAQTMDSYVEQLGAGGLPV